MENQEENQEEVKQEENQEEQKKPREINTIIQIRTSTEKNTPDD